MMGHEDVVKQARDRMRESENECKPTRVLCQPD